MRFRSIRDLVRAERATQRGWVVAVSFEEALINGPRPCRAPYAPEYRPSWQRWHYLRFLLRQEAERP